MPSAQQLLIFISAFAPGDEGAIHAYRLDADSGTLTEVHRHADITEPFFLALSPDRNFLYSIHSPDQFGGESHEEIAAYAIVGDNGELKPLNRQSALGSASCYLEVDATGKTVLVSNYSTGSVASFPVQADGSLGEAATFQQHVVATGDPSKLGPRAHCFIISPDNRFAFAADLGLDKVLTYQLDAAHSTLAPHRQPFVRTPPGAGPRHLTFHPDGARLYAINEFGNSVTVYDYDSGTGMLVERQTISTVPDDFEGKSYCADLKITPDGRFLYGTNRGHDSIAAYRIGEDGTLTLLGIEPSLGKGPQNLAIMPDGKLLLCANMPGDNVVLFRIDPDSGALTQLGKPVSMPSPSCIILR